MMPRHAPLMLPPPDAAMQRYNVRRGYSQLFIRHFVDALRRRRAMPPYLRCCCYFASLL